MLTRSSYKYWAEIQQFIKPEGLAVLSGRDILTLPVYTENDELVGYIDVAEGTVADFNAYHVQQVGDCFRVGDMDTRQLENHKRGHYYCLPES